MMNAISAFYEKFCGSRLFRTLQSEEGMGVVEVISYVLYAE